MMIRNVCLAGLCVCVMTMVTKAEEPAAQTGETATVTVAETATVRSALVLNRRPFTLVAAPGHSDGNVLVGLIALDYHFNMLRQFGEHGYVNPYSEFVLSYWEGAEGHTGVSSLHEIGLSILLRYRYVRQPLSVIRPYVDAGFGMHYLTEERSEGKELGRNWQAGSNVGGGLLFGRDERLELGLRIRHLSNAGTDEFNWGVNQVLVRLGVRF